MAHAPRSERREWGRGHTGPARRERANADGAKRRAWIAYLALAQLEHECDAALVVIALSGRAARASDRPIHTGHPGFVLAPIVIGPDTTPTPGGPGGGQVSAELAVLERLGQVWIWVAGQEAVGGLIVDERVVG